MAKPQGGLDRLPHLEHGSEGVTKPRSEVQEGDCLVEINGEGDTLPALMQASTAELELRILVERPGRGPKLGGKSVPPRARNPGRHSCSGFQSESDSGLTRSNTYGVVFEVFYVVQAYIKSV